MRYRLLCGISYRFQQLSPAKRQVTYALLTRSQLIRSVQAPSFSVLLACIRHAASVRPEPGSNSHIKFELSLISVTDRFIVFLLFSYYNFRYSALHIGSSCSVFKGLCRSRATTILVYHDLSLLSILFLKKFYFFESFFTFLVYIKKSGAQMLLIPL